MIKKTPFNYSNDMDRRRQGLDAIVENLLPDVETTDAGKIMKVGEDGKWHLGSDENTIIEANPDEGSASEELENLKIGNTIYSVNKPTFDTIKGLRITTADGGEYRTDRPTIRFYDDAGVELAITSSGYTASCDKSYAGSLDLTSVCSIATTDAPGAYTYIFNNDINVDTYHLIKLTNAGSFAGDIAKSIKLELSSNGEDFVTLWEDPAIAWSGSAGASRIIDIKTGSESSTILPIVTSADNGKVLGVVNGVWDKMTLSSKGTKIFTTTGGGANITLDNATGIDVLQAITDGYNVVINDSRYAIRYYFAFRSGSGNSHINFIALSGVTATSVTLRMYDINGNSSSNSVTSTSYTINFAT